MGKRGSEPELIVMEEPRIKPRPNGEKRPSHFIPVNRQKKDSPEVEMSPLSLSHLESKITLWEIFMF